MNLSDAESTRNHLLRSAERHYDRHNFMTLLELASEVCLETTPEYGSSPAAPLANEQRLIEKLGSRGLGLALDAASGETSTDPIYLCYIEEDPSETEYIGSFSPLREPMSYGSGLDMHVQRQTEQFGTALLSEAYDSLGTDVQKRIAEFVNARSAEEQINVLEWLTRRIQDMSDSSSFSDKFYHPVFLSPRMLGIYPNHTFTPSCLGKSILTASFLSRCEVPLLNSSPMRLVSEANHRYIGDAAEDLVESGLLLADSLVNPRLRAHSEQTFYALEDDPGFHSSNCVRLMDGSWYLVDPNFRSGLVPENLYPAMNNAYDDIHEFKQFNIPIERVVRNKHMTMIELGRNMLMNSTINIETSEINSLLENTHPDDLYGRLYEWTVEKIRGMRDDDFDDDLSETLSAYFFEEVLDEDLIHGVNLSTTLVEGFHRAYSKYVLWDQSPNAYLARIATDPAFKERAAEDIKALPALAFYCAMSLSNDVAVDDKLEYQIYEVGDASQRIGASVLSDFASYCGNDMSYSFWVSNWPSRIPITERYKKDQDDHAVGIQHNMMRWLDIALRFTKQDGIIKSTSTPKEGQANAD